MSQKFLRFLLRFSVIMIAISFCYSKFGHRRQDFQLLIDFTCATAKDELEKHPEMRTIALVELENNFPSDFYGKILKCLPVEVAKIILNPHKHTKENSTVILPKQTFVIYVTDKVDWNENDFHQAYFYFKKNFPVVHHLSKFLILSSDENEIEATNETFGELLNIVQISEENRKVIARSFDRMRNLTTSKTFEGSRQENLSQILFPDKTKNLNGSPIFAVYTSGSDAFQFKNDPKPNCRWTPFMDIIEEKLNATVEYSEIKEVGTSSSTSFQNLKEAIMERIEEKSLDFFLNFPPTKLDLESYNSVDWCLVAPLPKNISITDQILILPMDKSCWMWLIITAGVSTLVWRISEGHWDFPFGVFSYFMGQAQLVVRIRTNRLPMKILLQLLIFTIFVFSNGYQSIVTSFMLNPIEEIFLKSVDEVYDSDLKLKYFADLEILQGENPKYQKALQDGRIIHDEFPEYGDQWPKFVVEKQFAYAQPCEETKYRIEHEGDGEIWKGLYLMPEVVDTFPEDLYTRPLHPYIGKFQELIDRTFEAGLHKAWERFFWELYTETLLHEGEKRDRKQEAVDLLDFSLIAPFFLILAVGFVAAFVALFCEIFWHDFVVELSREYFKRKREEIFGSKKKKTKKVKVRIIKVKPAAKRNSV